MVITRLQGGSTSLEFEDIGYEELDCAKYLRCAYVDVDIENILLLWDVDKFLWLMVKRQALTRVFPCSRNVLESSLA